MDVKPSFLSRCSIKTDMPMTDFKPVASSVQSPEHWRCKSLIQNNTTNIVPYVVNDSKKSMVFLGVVYGVARTRNSNKPTIGLIILFDRENFPFQCYAMIVIKKENCKPITKTTADRILYLGCAVLAIASDTAKRQG
jgi:hypothetical protein